MPIKNTFIKNNNISYPFFETDDEMSAGERVAEKKRYISRLLRVIWWLPARISKRQSIAIILFLVIVGSGYGIYEKYFHLTDAEKAKKELVAAVASVSRHMILPENDEPVLATVTDATALISQQTFFTGAVNGDQLLLYPKNMKAIIWSPSRKMIVNVGPIEQSPAVAGAQNNADSPAKIFSENLGGQAQNQETFATADINQETQTQNSSASLKIAFYNGTKIVGLANEIESKLKLVSSDFETVAKSNAENKNYKETIVIDLTGGTKLAEAQSIASALGAKVGALPEREIKPNADILVIVGK